MGDDRWPQINPNRVALWSREPSDVVGKNLLSAFHNVKSLPLKRIFIQFWRPETIGGMRVLACYDDPYAVSVANHRLCKYRSGCTKYYYSISDDSGLVYDPMTISGAPPATAFLYHFPEVVLDLRDHRGTPLVDLALECELTCFMMLPLFYETQCFGVIEVSARLPAHLVVIFNELQYQLKGTGLRICPNLPQASTSPLPIKPMPASGLKLAKSEMEKALQAAVQSHALTLGQVWMRYHNCYRQIFRTLLGRLTMSCLVSPDDRLSSVKFFYLQLFLLCLKKGEGLIHKTLGTRQPHLCRNIYKLSDNEGILAVLSANTKCTCFVICLRSSHTGELDYAFEFFWPQSRNHLAMMEALLLTLREHLPSFKYASGARLGDELHVVDVENSSSGNGNTRLKIFPRNKMSSVATTSELTNFNDPESEDDDDDDLVIVAVYKVDYRLFYLPSSLTYKVFLEKINQEFELNPAGTYKIEYQVLPGQWYSLTNGTCLKRCISSYRASKDIDHIKLHVLE